MSTPITALPVTLPAGYCLGPLQEFVNLIIGGSTFSTNAVFSSYVIGAGVPAVTDHDKLWFRTVDGRTYFWDGTSWISNYWNDPFNALGASQFCPNLAASDLLLVDHDGSAVIPGSTDRSGPFWEEDLTMKGKFPLGYGTLQPSGDAVAETDTGGADEATLPDQVSVHTHVVGHHADPNNDDGQFLLGGATTITAQAAFFLPGESGNPAPAMLTAGNIVTSQPIVNGQELDVADPVKLSIMPPYQAGVWAKRTARKYFSVA
jgi:hypothetical protein